MYNTSLASYSYIEAKLVNYYNYNYFLACTGHIKVEYYILDKS